MRAAVTQFKVWDVHFHNWHIFAKAALFRRYIERFHIAHVTLLGPLFGGYYPKPSEIETGNDRTLTYMRAFPDKVSGLCYVNPSHERHAVQEWRRCRKKGMTGLKLWVATLCTDRRVCPVLEEVIAEERPILVHTWLKATGNLRHESTPKHMAELAQCYPQARFIMAHFGGNWEFGLKAIRDYPNVAADFSGSINEAGAYEMALREIGEDRILFGSDAPADYMTCLGRVLQMEVPPRVKRKILFENAERLFR